MPRISLARSLPLIRTLLDHPGSRRALRIMLWSATLLYFVFAVLVLTLRYAVFPQIENYRGNIEQAIAAAIKQPVGIRAIEAHWAGLRPVLDLRGVEIRDAAGRSVLDFEQVEAEPAWDSLWHWELRLARLELNAPQIVLRRDREGRFFAAGLEITPQKDNEAGFANWLLAQHRIVIRDATITWQDELRNAAPLELKKLNLQLDNSGRRHRFGLTAEPPRALAARLDIRGDFKGRDVKQPGAWKGQTYAEIDYADLAGWRTWVDYPVSIPQGSGALRLWLSFAQAQLATVTADVRLADVRLQLRSDLPELDLLRLDGRLAAERLENGFAVATQHLTLATRDGVALPPTNFRLSWQTASGHLPQGSIAANSLDLGALARLAAYLPLDEAARAQLTRHAPQGRLVDLALAWEGTIDKLEKWSVNSHIEKLGLSGLGPIAAISGISGRIEGNDKGGSVQLDGQNSVIDLPTILAEPRLELDAFAGSADWKTTADGLHISLQKATFANPDAAGEASGTWHALPNGPGEIDLVARLTRGNGNAVWRYMPLAVGQVTRDWLRTSILAGAASEATLTLKGDLRRFPFRGGPARNAGGLFEVRGKFHAATLRYATGWPDITGIEGELLFAGERMLITGKTGRIFGVDLREVHAAIADLETPEELLTITGKAAGPTTDFLRYIEASPVGERIDHFTEDMKAAGNGELELKLDLPLRHLADAKVAGKYRFDGNRLTVDADLPPLADVRGQLQFSADHLEARDIRGTLLGMPLAANIGTTGDGGVQINATGEFTVAALRRQFAHPVLDHLSGGAKWSGDVRVKKKSANIKIASSLVGLSSSLPEPFNKSASAPLAASFERKAAGELRTGNAQKVMRSGIRRNGVGNTPKNLESLFEPASGNPSPDVSGKPSSGAAKKPLRPAPASGRRSIPRDMLDIRLGRSARLQLVRRQDASPPVITQGLLTIGEVTAALPERALLVNVNLPQINADAWRRVLMGKADSDTTAMPALPALQFDLRTTDLRLFDKSFHEVRISGSRADPATTRFDLKSRELSGSLEWQSAGKGKLIARIDKFAMPETSVTPAGLQARANEVIDDLPALDISIGELSLKNRALGSVRLTAENRDATWHTLIDVKNDDDALVINGRWRPQEVQNRPQPGQAETQVDFDFSSKNIEKLLLRLGYAEAVRRGRASLKGNLAWRGAPFTVDYPSLSGKLEIDAANGQFKKLEPGVGRLLGILSLQTLLRRVTLDFRDIFGEGFAFDNISGQFVLTRGIMETSDLQIRGPSAKIVLKGTVDLGAETQNLQARVQPALGESVAVGAMLANPIAGAAVWAAQKILRDPLDQAFAFEYTITGSWAEPKVEKTGKVADKEGAP